MHLALQVAVEVDIQPEMRGSIDEVVEVLKKYAHDKTILLVEHKISKLEDFVDRLAVMHEGEIISCGECQATLNDPEVRRCYWKLES